MTDPDMFRRMQIRHDRQQMRRAAQTLWTVLLITLLAAAAGFLLGVASTTADALPAFLADAAQRAKG
jgi:ABC-type nitrate/sulfonate/bicarbonate transport system permease component